MNDYIENNLNKFFENFETQKKVAKVAKVAGEASGPPLPLYPSKTPSGSYPVDALGDVMGAAALAIASKCFVPTQMASQSVLAAACLAVQGHVDVQLITGQSRPCSLYLVTIAQSGDRKSTTDREASLGIRRHEMRLAEDYNVAFADWQIKHDIWSGRKARLKTANSESGSQFENDLKSIGPEPKKPLLPIVQVADPTIEGLIKNWPELPGSIGLFSAEGGQFVGGHGMMPETQIKTASALSQLWDGESFRRIRAGEPVILLHGRRLCMHMMLQPEMAAKFLSEKSLRDQGLLSRLNLTAPESLVGQRIYRAESATDSIAIERFNDQVFEILQKPCPLAKNSQNNLQPRILPISQSGEDKLIEYYNTVERKLLRGASLEHVQDVGSKAMENACRIAAVLAAFENLTCEEISEDCVDRAIKIADWYLNEAARLADNQVTDPNILLAQKLLDWFVSQGKYEFAVHDILNRGPSPLRQKKALMPVLRELIEHNWIIETGNRPKVYVLNKHYEAA